MRLLRPLPRAVTRPLSILVLVAWAGTMAVLVKRTYLEASSISLLTWWWAMRSGVRALEEMG